MRTVIMRVLAVAALAGMLMVGSASGEWDRPIGPDDPGQTGHCKKC